MRLTLLVMLAILVATALSVPALAWKEGGATIGIDGTDCEGCHRETWPWFDTKLGPHGNYTTSTDKCDVCHTIHAAPSSNKLLPAVTITDTCYACHDGTGGYGVYGAIEARGLTVGAEHSIDETNVIPGGDAATGGSAVTTFTGTNGYMSCGDCHSPHDSKTVAGFRGERIRFHSDELTYGAPDKEWRTSHLLRQRPTGADTTVTVYGSDWCRACHKGRTSGGAVHNHPVDASDTQASPFYYDRVAVVTADDSLLTTYGTMGLEGTSTPNLYWHARGFVMPSPRTTEQAGHYPICQQCHEDARDVGSPGAVNPQQVQRYGDGREDESGGGSTDTVLFQNFPHEGQNANFLVETGDDLCTNCHEVTSLP